MRSCEKCGKASLRVRHKVFLKGTDRPVYYCWSCASKAIEEGLVYTKHIVQENRLPPGLRAKLRQPKKPN